jgi:1-acyl-sn-glycerol-3-phosphate acyltransferase
MGGVVAVDPVDIDAIMNQPGRVQAWRRVAETVADGVGPLVDLSRPYVDGLQNLPRDGRFLLVGNHTQGGIEAVLIPYLVRRAIGMRVRPLADRGLGRMRGPAGDLFAACGVVVGAPETARELMRHDEPILVFPGGGREIPKFKGEENTLRWQGRSGFARLSVGNDYPIVPVGLIGGDDMYRSLTTREGRWGRLSQGLTEKLSGRTDMAMPLVHGIGPTLIPRPQRMYLRFAAPIDATKPARVSEEKWVAAVKQNTQESLEQVLADLLAIRNGDPYRELNPLAWRNATRPPAEPKGGLNHGSHIR